MKLIFLQPGELYQLCIAGGAKDIINVFEFENEDAFLSGLWLEEIYGEKVAFVEPTKPNMSEKKWKFFLLDLKIPMTSR